MKSTPLAYKNKIPVAAHRGNSAFFPENTMAAFRSASEIPFLDMVENDVHMTSDGELVIMHDHDVSRTTNGTGLIREMSFSEIRKLDAGCWKGEEFVGEKVPTLEEFLDLFKSNHDMLFNIELKDYPQDSGDFAYKSCDRIISTLENYGVLDRCVINSWNGVLNEYVAEKYGDRARIHAYYPEYLGKGQKRLVYDYAYCVCLFGIGCEPFPTMWYNFCRDYGVEPWAYYGPNDPMLYDKALENGVCLFTANDPVWVIEYLRSKGLHK